VKHRNIERRVLVELNNMSFFFPPTPPALALFSLLPLSALPPQVWCQPFRVTDVVEGRTRGFQGHSLAGIGMPGKAEMGKLKGRDGGLEGGE
jgi:hypothetical protein